MIYDASVSILSERSEIPLFFLYLFCSISLFLIYLLPSLLFMSVLHEMNKHFRCAPNSEMEMIKWELSMKILWINWNFELRSSSGITNSNNCLFSLFLPTYYYLLFIVYSKIVELIIFRQQDHRGTIIDRSKNIYI